MLLYLITYGHDNLISDLGFFHIHEVIRAFKWIDSMAHTGAAGEFSECRRSVYSSLGEFC